MKPTSAAPRSRTRGRLFVLEGPDGVGKTTLAKGLAGRLSVLGMATDYLAFPGGESGTVGELVYRIHHSRVELGLDHVTPTALQILHVAAHVDVIEQRIIPSLKRGRTVILDRYWWSAWVYGISTGVNRQVLEALVALERRCWGSLRPAAIFLVDRRRPLGPGHGAHEWQALRTEYLRLSRREAGNGRIVRFGNELPIGQAIDNLVSSLSAPKGSTSRSSMLGGRGRK